MKLQILLLTALPMCLAQFSIQGPTDGNRQAQGLKYSEEKGIEYTEQRDSQGDGGFTIQGATDGNSNFRIQGASDGHSNFQIQGPSDGGANTFSIQGATDGHSQSVIRGPYDANQANLANRAHQANLANQAHQASLANHAIHANRANQAHFATHGNAKSLSYNDPSGLRVNWRSYDRQPQPRPQAPAHYASEAAAPAPVARQGRPRHQQQAPVQHQAPVRPPVYTSFNNAPPQIKDLLQYQAQIPYLNAIPEPFRFDALVTSQGQQQAQQPQYQEQQHRPAPAPEPAQYRSKPRAPSRHRRQAPRHQQQSQPQYSTNVPSPIQQLLKYQSQIPYLNVIPEQYRYNPEPAIRDQQAQVRDHYQKLASQRPTGPPEVQYVKPNQAAPRPRSKRQAPQYQQQQASQYKQQQQQQLPQYRRISQPPAEPTPQYSTNLPGSIQQLLKFQHEIPYNIIANQIVYRPDKPYVPQPAEKSASPQVQYQGQGSAYQSQGGAYQSQGGAYQSQASAYPTQGSAYQGQASAYQGQGGAQPSQGSAYQSSIYTQAHFGGQQQAAYPQGQAAYGQGNVRPVTENQY